MVRRVDALIEARVHPFDPGRDTAPLYGNLLRHGLVRQWRNPGDGSGEADLVPGALDLDEAYHPVSVAGAVERRLTFHGAPADGLRLFQLSAARPHSDSYVLNNAVRWAEELVAMLPAARVEAQYPSRTPRPGGERDRSPISPPPTPASSPSVTEVRRLLRELLIRERDSAAPRDVVVLAVDGIPYELARQCWPAAHTLRMRSVYPTTSSAGWLSSLTGQSVAQHRVPGVVFALAHTSRRQLVNVFEYRGTGLVSPSGTIFSDAATLGYRPYAIPCDLEAHDCTWQDELLRGAQRVPGHRLYPVRSGSYWPRPPAEICDDVRSAIAGARGGPPAVGPYLVWCFIEVDRHVHEHGYDAHVASVLTGLGDIAQELAQDGALVVAHADHGLVPTRPDPGLSRMLDALRARFPFDMGGAGRTRWLYARPATAPRLGAELRRSAPASVRVRRASQVFPAAVRPRIGDVVLVAQGDRFLTEPGYRYDHGSATDAELYVPFSVWDARTGAAGPTPGPGQSASRGA